MPAEKTQPFCPWSRVLNWTCKGLIKVTDMSLLYSDFKIVTFSFRILCEILPVV
jgi:hypothetical protein